MFKIEKKLSLMIGSMPQKDPGEAMKVLKQYPLSIPTWPQLPKRSFRESMIPQYSEGFPGIRVSEEGKKIWVERAAGLMDEMTNFYERIVSEDLDSFTISPDYGSGLYFFLSEVEALSKKVPVIKGQVTGPFTFGLGLNDNEGKAVWFDEQYRDVVLKGISAKSSWVVKQLKKYGEKVILIFDEPILSALGTPAYIGIKDDDVIRYLDEVITSIQSEDVAVGVHCCGNMDWGLLTKTSVDIISFDAYFYGEKLALYPDEIKAFLEKGGVLAWGIVPTNDPDKIHNESLESLKQLLEVLIGLFMKKGIPEDRIRNQMICTPSCGMGTLSHRDSCVVLDLLTKISR